MLPLLCFYYIFVTLATYCIPISKLYMHAFIMLVARGGVAMIYLVEDDEALQRETGFVVPFVVPCGPVVVPTTHFK